MEIKIKKFLNLDSATTTALIGSGLYLITNGCLLISFVRCLPGVFGLDCLKQFLMMGITTLPWSWFNHSIGRSVMGLFGNPDSDQAIIVWTLCLVLINTFIIYFAILFMGRKVSQRRARVAVLTNNSDESQN